MTLSKSKCTELRFPAVIRKILLNTFKRNILWPREGEKKNNLYWLINTQKNIVDVHEIRNNFLYWKSVSRTYQWPFSLFIFSIFFIHHPLKTQFSINPCKHYVTWNRKEEKRKDDEREEARIFTWQQEIGWNK